MTQRTSAEISAELTEFRTARAALVNGERVEDVSRDGRRVRYATMSLTEIDAAILRLEREYEAAVSSEASRPRRRPIGLAWKN